MNRLIVSFTLCLGAYALGAQGLKEVDAFLDQEKAYQSLFYVNRLRADPQYRKPSFRFAVNNRLLESYLINRAPLDSIRQWVQTNEALYVQNTDRAERQYFLYLKAVAQESVNPAPAIEQLAALAFTTAKLKGNALLKLGDWHQNGRNYDQSVTCLARAIEAFRADSARFYVKLFRARYLLGISYKNLKQHLAAEAQYRAAFAILASIPEPMSQERARVLNALGNVYNETNDYANARKNYLASLFIKERVLQDSIATATTYNNLATFYMRFGNASEAKSCIERAVQLTPHPLNPADQVRRNTLISNYSALLREFGEFTHSRAEVRQALAASREILAADQASVIRLHLRVVEDALSLKDLSVAGKEMQETTLLMQHYPAGDALWNEYEMTHTNFLFETQQYDTCLRRSLQLLHRLKETSAGTDPMFYTSIKAGNAAGKILSAREALSFYEQAYGVALASGQKPKILQSLHTLAEAWQEEGELDSADYYTQKLMEINLVRDSVYKSSSLDFVDMDFAIAAFARQAETAFARYRSSHEEVYLAKASIQIGLALQWIKRKRDSFLAENDRLEFGDKVQEAFRVAMDIYFEQYQRFGEEEQLALLLQVAELSKAQSLMANLKRQGVGRFAGITQAVYNTEDKLFRRERDLLHDMAYQAAKGDDHHPEIYQEQLTEFNKLEAVKRNFLDSVQQNLPGYYQLKYDQTLVPLDELSRRLPANTLLLEYVSGQRNLFILGVSSSGHFMIRTPSSLPSVERLIGLLRNQLLFKQNEELSQTSSALYDLVIHPVDTMIAHRNWKTRELVIIPEGGLSLLPFELLKSPSKRGNQFLIERYSISYNYSATLYWQKTTDALQNPGKGVACFAPSYAATPQKGPAALREDEGNFQFTELTETKGEVDFIARLYEKQKLGKSEVYDVSASEATFKKMPFDKLNVVHLATHGFAGLSGPRQSGIVFGRGSGDKEDNILYTEEVYALHMPVELVTLSACETGLGKFYSGEGLVGLSRAFFYAGARSLLVSMWKVQDASTAVLMKNFYTSYFEGRPKAEALREAKLKMILSPEYRHPFYWSAFVLIGANP